MLPVFLGAMVAGTGLITVVVFLVTTGRFGAVGLENGLALPLLDAFRHSILPGWLFGILFTLFSGLHHVKRAWLFLLLQGVLAWALLFGGITVIDILEESPQIKPTLQFVKPESARLYLHHDQAFIATSIEGYSLKELYLFAGGTQAPGWQKVEEAVLDPYTEEILIPQNDTVILSDVHQGSWALFEVPPGWAGVVEDLHDMQAQFIGQGLVVRLMMTLALAFVMYSIWTLVRLTRWPLLNALLAFATVRGLLMLAVLSADSAVIELFLVVFNRSEPWFGMLIGYFILGLIFFLWGIILQPFGRWSKEVHV